MSKAMLIMDMPERCAGCKLSICLKDIGIGRCFATMELIDNFNKMQDWCPLREVPEKKISSDIGLQVFLQIKRDSKIQQMKKEYPNFTLKSGNELNEDYLRESYIAGYNTCIDEILGGDSNEKQRTD